MVCILESVSGYISQCREVFNQTQLILDAYYTLIYVDYRYVLTSLYFFLLKEGFGLNTAEF